MLSSQDCCSIGSSNVDHQMYSPQPEQKIIFRYCSPFWGILLYRNRTTQKQHSVNLAVMKLPKITEIVKFTASQRSPVDKHIICFISLKKVKENQRIPKGWNKTQS
jgi:hypothetical protein